MENWKEVKLYIWISAGNWKQSFYKDKHILQSFAQKPNSPIEVVLEFER